MPITSSAKKALRSSKRKRVVNLANKEALLTTVKQVKKLAVSSKAEAQKALSSAYKAIDKAAKKGVLKKNTASRKKSRLAAMVRKAA